MDDDADLPEALRKPLPERMEDWPTKAGHDNGLPTTIDAIVQTIANRMPRPMPHEAKRDRRWQKEIRAVLEPLIEGDGPE